MCRLAKMTHTVSEILRAMDCDCKIAKLQRLDNNTKTGVQLTDLPNPTHQAQYADLPNVDPQAHRSPPILVTFTTELDRFRVFCNAKSLASTALYRSVFVRKWLTKEELAAERILRDKCNKLNDAKGRNQSGHKPYVIIDCHVRERRNDNGRINYKKSVDID